MSRDLTPEEQKAWAEYKAPMLKCKCGMELTDDKEYIIHDCDYYPADIMEKDSIWDKPSNGFPLTSERGNRPNQDKEIQK